jgi:opacity protein-like surface antigen
MARPHTLASTVLLCLLVGTADVRAEWIVAPFAGMSFATSTTLVDIAGPFEDDFEPRPMFGAGLTWSRGRRLDIESEVGFGPDFFGQRTVDDAFQYADSSLLTITGNAKLQLTSGRIRPYVVGGGGVLRTHLADLDGALDAWNTQFGMDAGGGVALTLTRRLNLHIDARYFRTLQKSEPADDLGLGIETLTFWRTVGGVGYRF